MELKRGDVVWALVGYPMKPQKVTVDSRKSADRLSEGIVRTKEGFDVYESLVFRKKPKLVKCSDGYGEYTKWI